MCNDHKIKSRRKFLKTIGCGSLGLTTMFSTITNLGLMNAAAAANLPPFLPTGDYKALVCISLDGGNDSFNMLVPRGDDEYADYAAARSNLALAQDSLLSINGTDSNGKIFGLHPSLVNTANHFNNNKVAFVGNVGTLLQPTTLADYNNGSNLPLGLFSHLDQSMAWQSSLPQERSSIGWGGRLADILHSQNTNQNISMNFSLDGLNVFQNGNNVSQYTISAFGNGAPVLSGTGNNDFFNTLRRETLDDLMDQSYADILKTAYAEKVTNAQAHSFEFNSALENAESFSTEFYNTNDFLVKRMGMVARTIAARSSLGMSRQVFYINFGGFDTHGDNAAEYSGLLSELDTALDLFYQAMDEMGLSDQVTTFTVSDFGRTLTSNGMGSDHAWGSNCMVMGGAVNGGQIYRDYPDLYLNDNPLNVGQGRLIPTTSCDEYFAELALWFGENAATPLSSTQLTDILPNLETFWSPSPGEKPIGFL